MQALKTSGGSVAAKLRQQQHGHPGSSGGAAPHNDDSMQAEASGNASASAPSNITEQLFPRTFPDYMRQGQDLFGQWHGMGAAGLGPRGGDVPDLGIPVDLAP